MIANHKGEIPFVILIIPFLSGISLGLNYAGLIQPSVLIGLLIASSISFITLNIGYKQFNVYKIRWVGGVLISLILLLVGWISVQNHSELNRNNHFSKKVSQFLLVRINTEPALKNGLLRFTAIVEETSNKGIKTAASGMLLITLKDSLAQTLVYGDEILLPSNYMLVDPPFNPAEFNYKQYLTNQNIYYQSFLFGHKFALLAHDAGNPVIAYAIQLRQQLIKKLKANIHDPNAFIVASTMLLGYRTDLSNDVLQAYSQTGTVYILTVSGSQVAIIYLLLGYALSFLRHHKYGKLLRAILIICILTYYALLTGFSPAVCRVVLVVSMIVIGKTYNQYINTLNILAFSAFILLLYNPVFITDVGFQLAYIAVAGLIIFRPVVYNWFTFKNKFVDQLWSVCAVSISAQLVTFPLSAFYFHQFPVYFLVSNVLVIIPAAIVMYTGIFYLLLPQMSFISHCLGWILEKAILVMNRSLPVIQHLPIATINKIWLNTYDYILLYTIIISLFYFLYNRKIWLLKFGLICMLLLSFSISYKKISSFQTNSIAFLNLRSHTGIVLKNGTNAIVLSDLCDTDKNYRYSIQPYLDSCKINYVSIYNLKQDIKTYFAVKKSNLIQFYNKRILLFDRSIKNYQLGGNLKTDYVYIMGNPYTDFTNISKNYSYQTLLVSASNSDKFLGQIQQIKWPAKNFIVLKRNKALVAVSN